MSYKPPDILEQAGNKEALQMWRTVVTQNVRSESPDLSARQMAILLIVSIDPPPHTVRKLAEKLNISKPAICRALDTLSKFNLAKRVVDKNDRRNVFIIPTDNGYKYLGSLSEDIMNVLLEM